MNIKAHPLHLVLGLLLWSLYFIIVYGGMSVGCSASEAAYSTSIFNWINGFVLLVTLVFTLLLLWFAWQCHKATPEEASQGRFLLRLSAVLYLLSAAATLFVGLPGVIYPPCL